jgi:hypothetical protein
MFAIIWEERISSLIAAAGLIWFVRLATANYTAVDKLVLPMNAIYVTAIGVVIWLHAKWRRSVDIRRA